MNSIFIYIHLRVRKVKEFISVQVINMLYIYIYIYMYVPRIVFDAVSLTICCRSNYTVASFFSAIYMQNLNPAEVVLQVS